MKCRRCDICHTPLPDGRLGGWCSACVQWWKVTAELHGFHHDSPAKFAADPARQARIELYTLRASARLDLWSGRSPPVTADTPDIDAA